MIAATALEVLLIGLAVWQLVVVRRSLRRDRDDESLKVEAGDRR